MDKSGRAGGSLRTPVGDESSRRASRLSGGGDRPEGQEGEGGDVAFTPRAAGVEAAGDRRPRDVVVQVGEPQLGPRLIGPLGASRPLDRIVASPPADERHAVLSVRERLCRPIGVAGVRHHRPEPARPFRLELDEVFSQHSGESRTRSPAWSY